MAICEYDRDDPFRMNSDEIIYFPFENVILYPVGSWQILSPLVDLVTNWNIVNK